jgi:hypothetical protein
MSETAIKKSVNGVQKRPIPKLNDLVNHEVVNSNQNELQVFLNQEPPDKWIRVNKFANGSRYLAIDKIEYLLTSIFLKWYVEVLEWKVIANSVCVSVRLFYQSPINGEMLHQDGLGAMPMQTDEGKGAVDFNFIKTSAVQMALPGAESYAIKDAAEKIGRVFGKDLNRKELMAYENLSGRYEAKTPAQIEEERLINLIVNAESKEDLAKTKKHIKPEFEQAKLEFNQKLETFK